MEVILVLILLFLFIFGYFIMDRIDKFLTCSDFFPTSNINRNINTDKPIVLIFGYSELARKLILILGKYNIDYQQIEDENQLEKSCYYSHLFAISESDLNNLMITAITNRLMEIHEKIAICNCRENNEIFRQNNILFFNSENITAETLFNIMFPSMTKEYKYGK